MPSSLFDITTLLDPIRGDSVCGEDLRFSAEWRKIEDARRADDTLPKGQHEPKELKTADWRAVRRLSEGLLRDKTKDLRLGVLLLECAARSDGFAGATLGLKLLRELVRTFWDAGLHPGADGADLEARAAAFDWVNAKLPDILRDIPLTARKDVGDNYTFTRYIEARSVGRERDYEDGKVSSDKRDRYFKARDEGRSLDLYDAAMAATELEPLETLLSEVSETVVELAALNTELTPRFPTAEAAPGFTAVRETLEEIQSLLDTEVGRKRPKTPSPESAAGVMAGALMSEEVPALSGGLGIEGGTATANGWGQAEAMIRSGQIEQGLFEMARLAQRETSGRARFQRKLLLADVCLRLKKDRLARTVLEELAEQIDKFKLEEWETTDVVGAVWTRLHKIYRQADESEKAQKLYLRLCRLDPWQTLASGEE